MNENATAGQGFNNVAGGIGSILQGLFGGNGIADEIGALKGTNVPQNVTYVTAPQSSGISPIILIGGGLVLVIVLFMAFK